MAFSGAPAPTAKQVSDRLVRIVQLGNPETPFALDAGATGTIGLFEKLVAANITLPEGFKADAYSRPGGDVSLQDAVEVRVNYLNAGAVKQPINVVKTGTTPEDFQIAITNAGNLTTGLLEIYVEFH